MNVLQEAQSRKQELWEQLETATTWEEIKLLADAISEQASLIKNYRKQYGL